MISYYLSQTFINIYIVLKQNSRNKVYNNKKYFILKDKYYVPENKMSNNEKFTISFKDENEISSLYLHGYLDAHTAPILEKQIENIIDNKRYKILINFKNLDYISSAGLGVFMSFIENIRNHDGDIKLTEMNDKVFSIFDLLGFPILFDITEKDENAIEMFLNGNLRTNE